MLLIPAILLFIILLCVAPACLAGERLLPGEVTQAAPGIWRIRFGEPEAITPMAFREGEPLPAPLAALPACEQPPIATEAVVCHARARGCFLEIPLGAGEDIYGFGMQVNSFKETGLRKEPIVSSGPVGDTGRTHAPAPLYYSTAGYGVYVDTARYATFYCGTHDSLDGDSPRAMLVDIPSARGVDVYILAGPTLLQAVQRYNLFSGGGCMPPIWGLGVKYRVKGDYTQEQTLELAQTLRANRIPCDVMGLEPSWHTHAYSCTYVWERTKYPDPDALIGSLDTMGYRVNLWEHAYVHPTSPLFDYMKGMAGDYRVWQGLVPDFADERARKTFGEYHGLALVDRGVAAFKCDECDNAIFEDAKFAWGFPESSAFPSGADGEQMHQLLGVLYIKSLNDAFRARGKRTWFDVRASYALASPYPAVLYSDLYEQEQFLRMVSTASFSGHLWSPEVRQCGSLEELYRRVQLSAVTAQTCFNSWMIKNPPWLQFDEGKNNLDEFMPERDEAEAICSSLLEQRMALIPYLYAAFARYRFEGVPPFRALVMDYPDELETRALDTQFLIGDSLMAAPLFSGQSAREVYLPKGVWYDINTGQRFEGGQTITYALAYDKLPLFVKEGTILPLARPLPYVAVGAVFTLDCRVYGAAPRPAVLFEDDGESYAFEEGTFNRVMLSWESGTGGTVTRAGGYDGVQYVVESWTSIS